jgi:hypothetical protein
MRHTLREDARRAQTALFLFTSIAPKRIPEAVFLSYPDGILQKN